MLLAIRYTYDIITIYMEEQTIFENNYKQKTLNRLKSNPQYILLGGFALIVILGAIYYFVSSSGNPNVNTLGVTADQKDIGSAPAVEKLQKQLFNSNMQYITPKPAKPTATGGAVVESGQTSSISSGQVTYTKNKYIVQEGDSLASIAEQVYGDGNAWIRIAQANGLDSPDAIEVGMELTIPR